MEDEELQASIIAKLRFIARERAVRSNGHDEGFSVSINAERIKSETERARIKQPVLDNYCAAFEAAGFSCQIDNQTKSVQVFVPPVIDSSRTSFSLDDIETQTAVIREIRLREEIKLNEE